MTNVSGKRKDLLELLTVPVVKNSEAVVQKFTKCTRKHLCQRLFFNKVAGLQAQMFSSEFFEISKNTFFTEHRRVTASVN